MLSIQQQIQKNGSPVFNYTNSDSITTTTPWLKNIEDDTAKQPYLPFTQVNIVNSSTVDIYFYKNQNPNSYRLVKANSSTTLTNEPIVSWKVLTVSGTASASEIKVEVQTLPITQDTQLREEIGNPLKSLQQFTPLLSLVR